MKKSLLTIITLALCLVNLILTAVLTFTCMPAIASTNKLVTKVCSIIDLDVSGVGGNNTVSIENLEEVPVTFADGAKDVTVNLKTDVDGKSHVALMSVSLVLDKTNEDYATKQPSVANAMGLISNIIIERISQYTVTELSNNKSEIRREILGEIRTLFGSDFIYDVTFTKCVFQ